MAEAGNGEYAFRIAIGRRNSQFEVVAWSPDGKCLASASSDKTVRLWEAASGRERLTLEGHQAPVRHLARPE